jgi:hypothetical protein
MVRGQANILPRSENNEFENVAVVASIVEEGKGEFYLILGSGDHRCQRWKLTPSLLRKLSIESFNLAMKQGLR